MKKTHLLIAVLPLLAVTILSLPDTRAEDESLRILKFEADWCGPCQQMKPIFEKVSGKFGSEVTFQTINVDSQTSVADRYNVEMLPTVVAVKNGREVGRSTGYMSAMKLNFFIKKYQ